MNDNDRKYKYILDYYLNFNKSYNDGENNAGKNSHKMITWLDCCCWMCMRGLIFPLMRSNKQTVSDYENTAYDIISWLWHTSAKK